MNKEEVKCWICHRTEMEAQEESGLITSDGEQFYHIGLKGCFDYETQKDTKMIDMHLCSICAAIFQKFYDIMDEYYREEFFDKAIYPGNVLRVKIEEEIIDKDVQNRPIPV